MPWITLMPVSSSRLTCLLVQYRGRWLIIITYLFIQECTWTGGVYIIINHSWNQEL